jgi:hypothetical protein
MANLMMNNAIVKLTRFDEANFSAEKFERAEEVEEEVARKSQPVVMVARLDPDTVQYYSSKQYITVNLTPLDVHKVHTIE